MTANHQETIHIIYDSAGECLKLTRSEDLINAAIDDHDVRLACPIVAAGIETNLANWLELLDDEDWQVVAPHWRKNLKREALQSGRFLAFVPSIFETNPLDIPTVIALRRLEGLNEYGTPADIHAMIELTEIVFAHRNGRSIDRSLFRDQSLNAPAFHQTRDEAGRNAIAGRFQRLQDSMDTLKTKMTREMRENGFVNDESWEQVSRALTINSIKMNETAYLMAEKDNLGELCTFHDLWTHFDIDNLDVSSANQSNAY